MLYTSNTGNTAGPELVLLSERVSDQDRGRVRICIFSSSLDGMGERFSSMSTVEKLHLYSQIIPHSAARTSSPL